MKPAPLIAVAMLAAAPAHAQDARIATRAYDPARIVGIAGKVGFQSTIEFAADERVENIAIGDSSAWQVTPNRRANLVFLKPVVPGGRTNMTVVTSKRTYLFDLMPQAGKAPLLYTLRFTYAEPIVPIGAEAPPASDPAPVAQAAADPALTDPARFNFDWSAKGAGRLVPARRFDDGKSVFLAWDKGTDLPAILAIAADGTEGPLNHAARGDFVVIDGVPDRIVLRAGKDQAVLTNERRRAVAQVALNERKDRP